MKYTDFQELMGRNKKRNKDIDDNRYTEKIYEDLKIPHFNSSKRRRT